MAKKMKIVEVDFDRALIVPEEDQFGNDLVVVDEPKSKHKIVDVGIDYGKIVPVDESDGLAKINLPAHVRNQLTPVGSYYWVWNNNKES